MDFIIDQFLNYFQTNGHIIAKPSKLVRPSVNNSKIQDTLFTVAGMQQFTKYFLGEEEPENLAYVSAQPCIRLSGKHNDLDNIGYTTRHNTKFTMLGNFSFGAYGKKKAIELAWGFLDLIGIKKEYLYVTTHSSDPETQEIWSEFIGKDRIFVLDTDDNFWKVGERGLCGPSTEIFYDSKERSSITREKVNELLISGQELLELWNIVFISFNNTNKGYIPLDKISIDTGMGLERIASVLDGHFDNFQTTDIMNYKYKLESIGCPKKYLNMLSDHHLTIKALLEEGLEPGPSGANYVLRKLIRKCYFLFQQFAIDNPVLTQEINNYQSIINQCLKKIHPDITEEELVTIHHSYGLPWDIVLLEAKEKKLDLSKIQDIINEHKKQSSKIVLDVEEPTEDLCYEKMDLGTEITHIFNKDLEKVSHIANDFAYVICSSTVFYGEGGGQPGDIGSGITKEGKMKIINTTKQYIDFNSYIVIHHCEIEGSIAVNNPVQLTVNKSLRFNHTISHSAMHLLTDSIYDLFKIEPISTSVKNLGGTLDYQGEKLSENQINQLILKVNYHINQSIDSEFTQEICKNVTGVLSKEGKDDNTLVKVVNFPGASKQLCGGTHIDNTMKIGTFFINKHNSVGKNKYRITYVLKDKAIESMIKIEESTVVNSGPSVLYQHDNPKIIIYNSKNIPNIKHDQGIAIIICSYNNRIKGQIINPDKKIIEILDQNNCKGRMVKNLYTFGNKNLDYQSILSGIKQVYNI